MIPLKIKKIKTLKEESIGLYLSFYILTCNALKINIFDAIWGTLMHILIKLTKKYKYLSFGINLILKIIQIWVCQMNTESG